MASKLLFALAFSLFLLSQVSSDSKKNEESSHASQALHVLSRGDRKLMHAVLDVSKYLKARLIPRGVALAPAPAPKPSHGAVDCGGLCKNRCSLHSRPNRCLRACGTCCARCKCVPPGTFGNREVCGTCYTNMTTHGNMSKCP
ncbi:gibberellin-regulated protein 14-like [Salvia miltiorrhiza]|uniref:gibberellin-regulated protein 14-like n=1 Tax=Salvia miltiorrhiza TaxID=226208 RepID=UPI0025AC0A92|nr:gibberellin-regulated protein 14-like [Salvia miltiorrhiza]